MSTSLHDESRELKALAAQLAALGAETRAERRAKRVLPWVLSVTVHLLVAFTALFITWTVANLPREEDSVLIVAEFNAMQYQPVAATTTLEQQQQPSPLLDLAPPAPAMDAILQQLTATPADPLANFTPQSQSGDGALSQFAPAADMNAASFAGVKGSNARKIVYAIDASGSMIAHLQIVVDELSRSLANLSPQQSFAVIFFQENRAIEVPPGRLVPATPQERERAMKWISSNVVPRGGTNPLVALERALQLKPDVVFLLSQDITGYGAFEVDQRDLLAMLDRMNPKISGAGRRATQINCIQFLDADPLDTMRAIAQEHGGPNGYKFLSRKDLGLAR